jgi:integrase
MRARGEGGLSRSPHSRYWRAIWIDAQGVRRNESTKETAKGAAAEWLRQRLDDARAGIPARPDDSTLSTLRRLVLDDYAANGRRTSAHVRRAFQRLLDSMGDVRAREITSADVTAHIARRRDAEAAPATINRELAALRRGLRLAIRAGILSAAPDIQCLAEHNARKGFLEREALASIVAHLPEWYADAVAILADTGWRVSEVLSRQWRHVAGGALRLDPGETKNSEGREFPVTAEMASALARCRARTRADEQREGAIIPWVLHVDGEQLSRYALGLAWSRARAKAGHPGRLLHDLRRSRVREMERAGIPRSVAMSLVGHRTQAIYSRYAIVDATQLREAVERLEKAR